MTSYKNAPETPAPHFDFIVIGSGLAGLSLTLGLLRNESTCGKKILLVEKDLHAYPDRTWCFWEKEKNWWQPLVEKEWSAAEFFEGTRHFQTDLKPYVYKMIRSDTFRSYAFSIISQYKNVYFQHAEVFSHTDEGTALRLATSVGQYTASKVFDSRFSLQQLQRHEGHVLYQQFVGWTVETSKTVFKIEKACLMDFRAPQDKHVSFCYILPQMPNKALVEFTIFSEETYPYDYLENLLRLYMQNRFPDVGYAIDKEEKGIIPMTDYTSTPLSSRIVTIGTAGGCSKASSGYTFSFVQQHTKHLIGQLTRKRPLLPFHHLIPQRFMFYDRVLLRILKKHPEKGAAIFYRLFAKNYAENVFDFLLNRTTFTQEIKIFSKLPISLFLRMAWQELWRKQ